MKIYKIAQSVVFYHITTDEEAKSILQNGFLPGRRHYFTKPENLRGWFATLWLERRGKEGRWENADYDNKGLTILKITVPQNFYQEEIFDWDKDEFSGGAEGQISYGEGKLGWNTPDFDRQPLQNGVNCKIEVLDDFKLLEGL